MEVVTSKSYIIKVIVLTLGNIVAAIGVSLCALAGKGVDPLTVLYQGICNITGFEIGLASLSVNIVMLIMCLIVDRRYVKSGTIISMFTFSIFLNYFINSIRTVFTGDTAIHSWMYLALGIILMGVGFSTCIFAGIGTNCLDVVLQILMDKTKLSMKRCKIIVDFTSAVLGVLLGAKFGIGTVLCVILVGVIYTYNTRLLAMLQIQWEEKLIGIPKRKAKFGL